MKDLDNQPSLGGEKTSQNPTLGYSPVFATEFWVAPSLPNGGPLSYDECLLIARMRIQELGGAYKIDIRSLRYVADDGTLEESVKVVWER